MSGKKNKKLKHINHISQPLNIRHNFHLGADGFSGDFNEEEIRNLFSNASKTGPILSPRTTAPVDAGENENQSEKLPPTPCRSRDISSANSVASDADLVTRLKEELIPALRFEMDELLDKKLARLLPELAAMVTSKLHCKTCQCHDNVHNKKRKGEQAKVKGKSAIVNGYSQEVRNDTYEERGTQLDRARHGISEESKIKDDYLNVTHDTRKDVADKLRMQLKGALNDHDVSNSTTHRVRGYSAGMELREHRENDRSWSYKDASPPSCDTPRTSKGINTNFSNGEIREEIAEGDERDCLAHAIEANAKHIMRALEEDVNELTEQLFSSGCITEQDNNSLQVVKTIQEQSRLLLTIIAGRDLHVLQSFLRIIKHRDADLHTHITQQFHQNVRGRYVNTKCVLCRLNRYVDVKYILETLWTAGIVDDDFRDLAINADLRTGGQNALWDLTVQRLNETFQNTPNIVVNALRSSLTQHSYYEHLAGLVESALSTEGCLSCTCSHVRPAKGEVEHGVRSAEESPRSATPHKHYIKHDAGKSHDGHRHNMSISHHQSRNTAANERHALTYEEPDVLAEAYDARNEAQHERIHSPASPGSKEIGGGINTSHKDIYSRNKTQNERFHSPATPDFQETGDEINTSHTDIYSRNKTQNIPGSKETGPDISTRHNDMYSRSKTENCPASPVSKETGYDTSTTHKAMYHTHQDRVPDLSSYIIGNGKAGSTQNNDAEKSHASPFQRSTSLELLNEGRTHTGQEDSSLKTKRSHFEDPKKDQRIPVPAQRKSLMVTKEGKDLKASFV